MKLQIQDRKIALVIFSYVVMTVFVIIAAQLVLNQGAKLHRVLAQLYNKMIEIGKFIIMTNIDNGKFVMIG